jgi:FkbM family methyltransferase
MSQNIVVAQRNMINNLSVKYNNTLSVLNSFNENFKNVVFYKGIYWPIKDSGGDINSEFANPNSTCYKLMVEYPDVPVNVSKFVKNHRVILQAGGNVGFYVKKYSDIFDQVYTFEPEPLSFFCLNLNVTKSNVYKYQACLGDTHECVNLFNACETPLGHGGSHITGPGLTPTLMIDDLNLQICDLIHLDIEGYEKKALLGGVKTIQRCKPVIVLENYAPWLARYGTNIGEIEELLTSFDYKFIEEVQGDRVYQPTGY